MYVASGGTGDPVGPTDKLLAKIVPVIGRGLDALNAVKTPATTSPIWVELVGPGPPFRPTDALDPPLLDPPPVPWPMIRAFMDYFRFISLLMEYRVLF
jgi:hypothetical protein